MDEQGEDPGALLRRAVAGRCAASNSREINKLKNSNA